MYGSRPIETCIRTIRNQKVILAAELAEIYGVETKRLNEAVKHNAKRFPPDFVFRLSTAEAQEWLVSRSQFATLKRGQNIKYSPYAFTEHALPPEPPPKQIGFAMCEAAGRYSVRRKKL